MLVLRRKPYLGPLSLQPGAPHLLPAGKKPRGTIGRMGFLLLEGGAEFGGRMSEPDQLAGGPDAPVAILPTAAALDHNHEPAGRNGLRWFGSLGSSRLDLVPVIDRASADDPALAARIRSSRLIYMLGGFPGFLASTLAGSLAWRAALDAFAEGAVLGGSSAGAMVMCQHLYDPERGKGLPGWSGRCQGHRSSESTSRPAF